MIDYLKKCGISNDTILKIQENNDYSFVCDLSCNAYECEKIISYMSYIGITVIDDILINYIDVFLQTYDKFLEKIEKKNIPDFVKSVNKDYNYINNLFE